MIINLPFLLVGYKQIGKTFVIHTVVGITFLGVFVTLLHPVPELTDDLLLASDILGSAGLVFGWDGEAILGRKSRFFTVT